MGPIQAIVFFFALLIAGSVIFLMIKQKYTTRFALFWLIISFAAIIQGLFPQVLNWICAKLGIDYPPTLVLVAAISILLVVTFYIYLQIAALRRINKSLSQQVSILSDELTQLKDRIEPVKEPIDEQ